MYSMNNHEYNGEYPRRKILRDPSINYSSHSSYHVILSTYRLQHLFARYIHSLPYLNQSGCIAMSVLYETLETYGDNQVCVHTFAIMPDHIHLLIQLLGEELPLQKFVTSYKLRVAHGISEAVKSGISKPYQKHIWQKEFYDTRIRGAEQFDIVYRYIRDNPYKVFRSRLDQGFYNPLLPA